MKIDKLTVGQTVYSVERRNMGNTTLRTTSVFDVRIMEIDPEKRWVMASWNGNTPRKYYLGSIVKWKEKEPVLVHSMTGSSRLATEEEKKSIADGFARGHN
jgi:hypothetical protein